MNEADRELANLQSHANYEIACYYEDIERFKAKGGEFKQVIDEFFKGRENSAIPWRELEELTHKLYEMDED